MLLRVHGLKSYDGFYVKMSFENSPLITVGPFYESENILLDKFIRMVNHSAKTQQSLSVNPEFMDWWNCKSSVKNFTTVAKRIDLKNIMETVGIRKNTILSRYTVVYKTGGNEFVVSVEDINQSSCFFEYGEGEEDNNGTHVFG